MADYRIGEIVDIALVGVRVSGWDSHGGLTITAQGHDGAPRAWPVPPQAQVTRVAPAEWPPQPGDLWRDRTGELWFAVDISHSDESEPNVRLVQPSGGGIPVPVRLARVVESYGPLTLVRREQQAGGEPRE